MTLQDVLRPEIAYCSLVETLNAMCLGVGFEAQDSARQILDGNFAFPKATRLLGLLRRLQTETMEDLRRNCGRSTFYSDKRELRVLGLWPPSAWKEGRGQRSGRCVLERASAFPDPDCLSRIARQTIFLIFRYDHLDQFGVTRTCLVSALLVSRLVGYRQTGFRQ